MVAVLKGFDEEGEEEEIAPPPLPEHVTEEKDGSWLYQLQHPLEPSKDDPNGTDINKIRIPRTVYTRNVRYASRKAETAVDVVFYLACSLTKVPPEIMDRLDARDYGVVSNLISRISEKNPTSPVDS